MITRSREVREEEEKEEEEEEEDNDDEEADEDSPPIFPSPTRRKVGSLTGSTRTEIL